MKLLRIILVIMIVLTVALAPVMANASGKKKEMTESRKVWDTIWRIVNSLILFAIIFKVARKPLAGFFKERAEDIEKNLSESQATLDEAREEHQRAEKRLSEIAELVDDVKSYMKQDAERTRNQIIEDAEENSQQIIAHAKELASNMVRKAQEDVKAELVRIALEEAEKVVRREIRPEDHNRLIGEYLTKLEAKASAA